MAILSNPTRRERSSIVAPREAYPEGMVLGVRTTKIYCRPTCRPPRRPKPENCLLFPNADAARAAGFRACRLCRPDEKVNRSSDPSVPGADRELIRQGTGATPLGPVFVARSDRGIRALFLGAETSLEARRDRVRKLAPDAAWIDDDAAIQPVVERLAAWLEGGLACDDLPVDLRGTPFQVRVWNALREIPMGSTWTYGELAKALGQPNAARAVGAACGANPVAILVPCHRVVGSDGSLVNYRWGLEFKRALLDVERARPSKPARPLVP